MKTSDNVVFGTNNQVKLRFANQNSDVKRLITQEHRVTQNYTIAISLVINSQVILHLGNRGFGQEALKCAVFDNSLNFESFKDKRHNRIDIKRQASCAYTKPQLSCQAISICLGYSRYWDGIE